MLCIKAVKYSGACGVFSATERRLNRKSDSLKLPENVHVKTLKRDASAAEADCGREPFFFFTCDSEVSAEKIPAVFKTFILSVCTDDLLVHSGIQSCFQHEAAGTKADFKLTLEQQTIRAQEALASYFTSSLLFWKGLRYHGCSSPLMSLKSLTDCQHISMTTSTLTKSSGNLKQ